MKNKQQNIHILRNFASEVREKMAWYELYWFPTLIQIFYAEIVMQIILTTTY